MKQEKPIRINKYLSHAGYCSRREADRLLAAGKITLNGKQPEIGVKVNPGDVVKVHGKLVTPKQEAYTYLAFNKPKGIVCTTAQKLEKNNIIDYINYHKRIYPIGRLDKMSEGLILLTDDGEIVNRILRSRNDQGKEYVVKVNRPVTEAFINKMGAGVPILNTVTKKCQVRKTGSHEFHIVLTQGLNRQIRRMCEYFGFKVVALKRIRVINIKLDLPVGKYRNLTPKELQELKELTQ